MNLTLLNLYFFVFLSLLLSFVNAQQFPTNLGAGETQTYTLGIKTYTVDVLVIDKTPFSVNFNVNGEQFRKVSQGSSITLQDGVIIQVHEIFDSTVYYTGSKNKPNSMTFSFANYCGDNLCSSKEDCSSCANDCACNPGSECVKNQCLNIFCGDGRCSQNENCIEDLCCRGRIVQLNTEANCGACGNRCGLNQECRDGLCKERAVCGNNVCEDDEESCIDCSPEEQIDQKSQTKNDQNLVDEENKKRSNNNSQIEAKENEDIKTKDKNLFVKLFLWIKSFFS